jgi:DNA-binding GntR family transcriptional regulator
MDSTVRAAARFDAGGLAMSNDATRFTERGRARPQLPEEVAEYVRELIIGGRIRPGEFLRMESIAEAVGVSNTPVREGLLTLRSEGFVELVPRRGFVAASFDADDVRDLFWVQAQLASELAARAATRISPEQIDELESVFAGEGEAAQDPEKLVELGRLFHRQINRAAGSRRLSFLLGGAARQLPQRLFLSMAGRVRGAREDHGALLAAFHGGDPDAARAAMNRHVLAGADELLDVLASTGLGARHESAS